MRKQRGNLDIEYVMNNIIKSKIMDVAETMRKEGMGRINSDVMGSYKGLSNKNERPVQDADDL